MNEIVHLIVGAVARWNMGALAGPVAEIDFAMSKTRAAGGASASRSMSGNGDLGYGEDSVFECGTGTPGVVMIEAVAQRLRRRDGFEEGEVRPWSMVWRTP